MATSTWRSWVTSVSTPKADSTRRAVAHAAAPPRAAAGIVLIRVSPSGPASKSPALRRRSTSPADAATKYEAACAIASPPTRRRGSSSTEKSTTDVDTNIANAPRVGEQWGARISKPLKSPEHVCSFSRHGTSTLLRGYAAGTGHVGRLELSNGANRILDAAVAILNIHDQRKWRRQVDVTDCVQHLAHAKQVFVWKPMGCGDLETAHPAAVDPPPFQEPPDQRIVGSNQDDRPRLIGKGASEARGFALLFSCRSYQDASPKK